MGAKPKQSIPKYLLALLIFAVAVLVRILLDFVVPERLPFISFFPAVLLAAFYCGIGPSILVVMLSAVVGSLWAEPTGISPAIFYLTSILLFGAVGGINIALVHFLMSSLAHVQQRDEQLALINRELKHRIKNLFSVANFVCLQTIKSGRSTDEMSAAVSGRIQAIASAQDLLGTTATGDAELDELVAALVATLAPESSRLKAAGPPTKLPSQTVTPFALVLHELATNALKYGAWSQETGYVKIGWSTDLEVLLFVWREHDGPVVAPPPREGLGKTLIKSSLPGAEVNHDLRADGLECQIRLPLTRES